MDKTCYSAVGTDELILFACSRDNRTDMETELAQRLMLAMDMLSEMYQLTDCTGDLDFDGIDARR